MQSMFWCKISSWLQRPKPIRCLFGLLSFPWVPNQYFINGTNHAHNVLWFCLHGYVGKYMITNGFWLITLLYVFLIYNKDIINQNYHGMAFNQFQRYSVELDVFSEKQYPFQPLARGDSLKWIHNILAFPTTWERIISSQFNDGKHVTFRSCGIITWLT